MRTGANFAVGITEKILGVLRVIFNSVSHSGTARTTPSLCQGRSRAPAEREVRLTRKPEADEDDDPDDGGEADADAAAAIIDFAPGPKRCSAVIGTLPNAFDSDDKTTTGS